MCERPSSLSIELVEVRESKDTSEPVLSNGPFHCVIRLIGPHMKSTVWKKKTSTKAIQHPPIPFKEIFEVGEFSTKYLGGWLQLFLYKAVSFLDSLKMPLNDGILNQTEHTILPLQRGKGAVVFKFTLKPITPKGEPHLTESKKPNVIYYNSNYVTVSFNIHYKTNFGEQLYVCGSASKLGNWNLQQAKRMEWTEGDVWTLEITFRKCHLPFEYKYVVVDSNGNARWECTANRTMKQDQQNVLLKDSWECP